jgi:hypothetical protein
MTEDESHIHVMPKSMAITNSGLGTSSDIVEGILMSKNARLYRNERSNKYNRKSKVQIALASYPTPQLI